MCGHPETPPQSLAFSRRKFLLPSSIAPDNNYFNNALDPLTESFLDRRPKAKLARLALVLLMQYEPEVVKRMMTAVVDKPTTKD